MTHPEIEQGLESPLPIESAAKMQAILDHSSSGCVQCVQVLETLRAARADGRMGRDPEPPGHTVDSVKEAFVLNQLRRISPPAMVDNGVLLGGLTLGGLS